MFALKTLRRETGAPALPALRLIAAAALALTWRPVPSLPSKWKTCAPCARSCSSSSNVDVSAELSGEVVPRVESQLGFRVGGKIVARKVDVGASVKKGQVLMQLDPVDLQLSQAQAKASLLSAETSRDLARAELKRYQDLREKNFVSQAVLDGKDATYKAAQANVEAAQAPVPWPGATSPAMPACWPTSMASSRASTPKWGRWWRPARPSCKWPGAARRKS